MAAKTQAPPTVDQIFGDLRQVQEQMEAAKDVSRETLTLGRTFTTFAGKVEEVRDLLVDVGADDEDIKRVAELLDGWGTALIPQASQQWSREELNAKVAFLDGFSGMGYLTEEQNAELGELKEAFKASRQRGNGLRTPRGESEKIEGRPEKVALTNSQGETFAKQAGNINNSVSNLKNAVKRYLSSQDVELDDTELKALTQAVKEVVENGTQEFVFAGIKISVYNEGA